MLSAKLIYHELVLMDPELFKRERAIDNLFYLDDYFKESDLYRRTGKTTKLIVDTISFASEKNKIILILCRDYQNVRYFIREAEVVLKKLVKNYNYLSYFIKENEIIFDTIKSKIIVRSDLDTLWSEPYCDVAYRDE